MIRRGKVTAKEYLKNYAAEKELADDIERRIAELQELKKSVRAVAMTGAATPRRKKDLSDVEAKIDALIGDYMATVASYVGKEAHILEKLEEMTDAKEKRVLLLRYIKNKDPKTGRLLTWYDIADIMGYAKRTVESIHGSALQNIGLRTE